jgi:hypothetical protein
MNVNVVAGLVQASVVICSQLAKSSNIRRTALFEIHSYIIFYWSHFWVHLTFCLHLQGEDGGSTDL